MVYDQYILANNNDYSGSYTDYVSVKTMVKTTNIANGVLLDQITHSWADGVSRSPSVFYTFDNDILDHATSGSNRFHLTLFTGSKGTTATYDGDDIKPGVKSYGFNNTILSASGLFRHVFNGFSKQYTIEFLMKPKSRTPEGFTDTGIAGAPSQSWDGTGFTGVGSQFLEHAPNNLKFSHDANSRGLFGIHSSGSSTIQTPAVIDSSIDFYPKSLICYGHDLIEHGTNVSPISLHGSRVTGLVIDDGDYRESIANGTFNVFSGIKHSSYNDYDFKKPQTYFLNEWQYVVMTRDSTTFKLYINGNLIYENNRSVEDASYATDLALTFGVNPEVLWRIQAIQNNATLRSPSNPTYAQPWFPSTNKGWPHILKNLTADAQQLSVFATLNDSYYGTTYEGINFGYPDDAPNSLVGPPSSSFLDTLCWTGSLSHWKLYQGAALEPTAIKIAYDKIFAPTFSIENISLGLKTTSFVNKNIHDLYSRSSKTISFESKPSFKNISNREVSLPIDFLNGKKDVMYSNVVEFLSGTVGKNKNFNNFEDNDEVFYDSLVASPVDYHLANGAQLILFESGSNQSNFGFSNLEYGKNAAFALPIIGKGVNSAFLGKEPGVEIQSNKTISGSDTLTIGDTLWPYFYPFDKQYKNLQRLKKPTNILTKKYNVKLGDSGSMSVLPWSVVSSDTGGRGYVRSTSDGVLNTSVDTDIFSGMLVRMAGTFDNSGVPESNNFEKIEVITNADFSLKDTIQFMQQGNLTGLVNASVFNKKIIASPKIYDTNKTYFGIGRKFNITHNGPAVKEGDPYYVDNTIDSITSSYNIDGGVGYMAITGRKMLVSERQLRLLETNLFGIGAKVEGWKYGLYSAIPTKNTAIFRRDRFGHFRDMLEQRLFTKFSLGSNNTITKSPVEIRFVTDSDASITSSMDLDNNSSGIYHFEYASGKPFVERDEY